MTTSGPGLTNMITPLLDSLNDGVPLIFISGQVALNSPPDAFQDSPSLELTKKCTKWNYQVTCPSEIKLAMEVAFKIALSGRPGPVHIDIPVDIQTKLCIEANMTQAKKAYLLNELENLSPKNIVTPENKKEVLRLFENTQRPLLYIGQGAADSSKEVLHFIEKMKMPFTTTLHAKGVVDERHIQSLGMIGMHGNPVANIAAQKADLIIALGSRFDDRTVGNLEQYAPVAHLAQSKGVGGFIHVDIRKSEKNKIIFPAVFSNTDVGDFLSEINPSVPQRTFEPWLSALKKVKAEKPVFHPVSNQKNRITVQNFLHTLNEKLPKHHCSPIITTGVGVHQMVSAQMLQMNQPRHFISSGSLGTMGVALPYAVGAQNIDKSKLVVAIDGDGSFNMSNTELKTIMNEQLPIKIAVINNSTEMMVEYWQKLFYENRYISTPNENCDYNLLARAYNFFSLKTEKNENLDADIDRWLGSKGPALINVITEPTPCLPLVAPGSALDDMILMDEDYKIS